MNFTITKSHVFIDAHQGIYWVIVLPFCARFLIR